MKNKNKKFLVVVTGLSLTLVGFNFLDYDNQTDFADFIVKKKRLKSNENTQNVSNFNIKSTKTDNKFNQDKQFRKVASIDRSRIEIKPKKIPMNMKAKSIILAPKFKKEFYVHEDLFAISEKDYISGEYEVVEKKLGFYIVRSPDYTPQDSLKIVTKEGSRSLSIFTHVLKLKLKNNGQVEDILGENSFEILEDLSHLNRALVKFDDYETTMDSYEKLKNHINIDQVEVELLEYQRVPK